ncbi:hypothetical protein Taro_040960 [Colocasia esculenta]|uniref:Uncharacterized protein n=1 Tax=Colocasia esculenta TaxID=4460 RepID=A0A843WKA4_COLES|nr:hypothetical protein [Colocasia esculenta]
MTCFESSLPCGGLTHLLLLLLHLKHKKKPRQDAWTGVISGTLGQELSQGSKHARPCRKELVLWKILEISGGRGWGQDDVRAHNVLMDTHQSTSKRDVNRSGAVDQVNFFSPENPQILIILWRDFRPSLLCHTLTI